jgi:SM-20-related protein
MAQDGSPAWRGFPFAAPDDDTKPACNNTSSRDVIDEAPGKRKHLSEENQSKADKKKAPVRAYIQPRVQAKTTFHSAPTAKGANDGASAPCEPGADSLCSMGPRPDADDARARASMPRIAAGSLAVTPHWLSPRLVNRLRADAAALKAAGAFSAAAVGGATAGHGDPHTQTVRAATRRCEACGLFDDALTKAPRGTGDPAARGLLFAALASLRHDLELSSCRGPGLPLADAMELQYLCYPGGGPGPSSSSNSSSGSPNPSGGAGFYGRHVDQQVGVGRAVSLLVYLNGDASSDGGPWCSNRDGGQLVAYPKGHRQLPERVDPIGGTLVLFDSRTLEHEALPTRRPRWALVGWFLEPRSGDSGRGRTPRGGGGPSKKSKNLNKAATGSRR